MARCPGPPFQALAFAREAVHRRLRDEDWAVVCAALELTSDADLFPVGAPSFAALVSVAGRAKEDLLSGAWGQRRGEGCHEP